jgi:hypothetical protein
MRKKLGSSRDVEEKGADILRWKPYNRPFLRDSDAALKAKFGLTRRKLSLYDEKTLRYVIGLASSAEYLPEFASFIADWAAKGRTDLFIRLGRAMTKPHDPWDKIDKIIMRSWSTGNDTAGIPLKHATRDQACEILDCLFRIKISPDTYRHRYRRLGLKRDVSKLVRRFITRQLPSGEVQFEFPRGQN